MKLAKSLNAVSRRTGTNLACMVADLWSTWTMIWCSSNSQPWHDGFCNAFLKWLMLSECCQEDSWCGEAEVQESREHAALHAMVGKRHQISHGYQDKRRWKMRSMSSSWSSCQCLPSSLSLCQHHSRTSEWKREPILGHFMPTISL